MTLEKDDLHIAPTDDQIADLKKAIADLAEGKRVTQDSAGSEVSGTDPKLPPYQSDAHAAPPLSQYKWPLASGIVGIVLGFVLSILL